MGRFARVVVLRYPYHVTHRGNRRTRVFLESVDFDSFRAWLMRYEERDGMRVYAYCLMSNYLHLGAEPVQAKPVGVGGGRENWGQRSTSPSASSPSASQFP